MTDYKRFIQTNQDYWQIAERLVTDFLDPYRPPDPDSRGGAPPPSPPPPPELWELDTATRILRRIQLARRTIHRDAIQLEPHSPEPDHERDPMDDEEIARLIKLLDDSEGDEQDGDEPDDEQAPHPLAPPPGDRPLEEDDDGPDNR